MPIDQQTLETLIKDAFPDADITITDLAGDGDHYSAQVISEAFKGVPRVKQHQMVYKALSGKVESGELHALALQTKSPIS